MSTHRLGPRQDDIPITLQERVQPSLTSDIEVHVDSSVVMQDAIRMNRLSVMIVLHPALPVKIKELTSIEWHRLFEWGIRTRQR
jgi:hypothetical protein